MHLYLYRFLKYRIKSLFFLTTIATICSIFSVQAQLNPKKKTPVEVVKLQLKWKHQFQFAGYYAAQAKGFYATENLKVDILEGNVDTAATEMVAANKAQYGIGDSEILLDFANGKPLVVLGAIFQHSPYILLSLPESNIQSPSDLVGKRVMVGENQGAEEFKAMIKNEGIPLNKVNFLTQSWQLQDLIDGKVDAVSAYFSFEPNLLRSQGIEPKIMHSISYGVDFYGDTLFTSRNELQENPKRVAAFLKATKKGWVYALQHKAEIADLIVKMNGVRQRGITHDILLNEAKDMEPLILSDIVEIGHINPSRWQHIADVQASFGLIKKDLDLTDFIYVPVQPSIFPTKYIPIAILIALISFALLLAWYFKTRQKILLKDNKLTIETSRRIKSEEMLKMASSLAHVGGWDLDVKTMQLSWSDEVSILHDMPPGSVPSHKDASNMITSEWRDQISKSLDDCILYGKPYDQEFQKITAKNRPIWVRSVAQPFRNENGEIVRIQGALQDISTYKKLEIFSNKQSAILESIASSSLLSNVLEDCIQLIEDHSPDIVCVINLLDNSGTHLKTGSFINMPADYLKSIDGMKIGEAVGSCGTAAYEKREVIVSDIANDPLWKDYKHLALNQGFLACWSWPIFSSKGQVIGTFAAYSKQISSPTQEELKLIRAITKTVGIAIEKQKSSEQIHLLESAISRLNDIVLITEADSIKDPGPIVVFVNDAFEKRTGYSREEIIGKTPRILQGEKTDKAELKRIHDALEKWEPVRSELINYKKDGEAFWLELDIVPIADATGWFTHWVAVERDITARKENEIELIRLNRALRLLTSCNEALMRVNDEKLLINEICKLAVEIGGYSMAWVGYAQHDDYQSIMPMGSYGNKGVLLDALTLSWSAEHPHGKGPGGKTIRTGKTVVLEEIANDLNYPAIKEVNQEGYLGVMTLPLKQNEQCFGILGMFSSEVRSIPAGEIKLLEEIADHLSFGILAIRAKIDQEKMQAAVSKVASSVSVSTSNQFFEQLIQNMIIATDSDAGFIATLSSSKKLKATTLAAIVDGQPIKNFTYDVTKSPCNKLLHAENFILSNSVNECFPSKTMIANGMQDYVGQRLTSSKGVIIGMIFVMKRETFKNDSFTVSTLKIFATRAAAEIERQSYDRHISEQASLLNKAQDAIIVRGMDDRVQFWNKGAERLYGWTEKEAVGQSIVDLIYLNKEEFFESNKKLLKTGEFTNEINQKRKDKSELFAEVRWTLVKNTEGKPQSVLCINTDITQRKVAAEEIQHMAFYDALTSLPNRLLLQERLKHALASSVRNDKYGALLFIDIDNFKTINDTLGHSAGDILLKSIAKRLQENTRESDTVSRLGGDEFIVMLEALSIDSDEAAVHAKQFGEKLIQLFQEPFDVDNHRHYSSPSIGITLFKSDSQSVTELLKQADLAMYQAKAAGRNTYKFFDPKMQENVTNRVEIEVDLREALKKNEFLLHYQPQMNANGQCIGAEALLRWNSQSKGMISPAQFIPLAEETRLILPIGEWVLKTACEALVKWEKIPEMAGLQLAVNVSVHQFRLTNFVEQVLKIVQSIGANPARLKLELTESLFVENVEDIITKMDALKAKGIEFSLDDFGTGYSSLSYLKRLPLAQLKIDQSFVRDVLIDNHDATIARSIITLGKNLGLDVIAEGVELLEQKEFLLKEGCHLYQGYYFSRPLPIDGLENFIKTKTNS